MPVEVAYQVVADVERYPEFLPGCAAVEIKKRSEHGLEAAVTAEGAGLTQTFVTANRHDPSNILMSLKKGPFKSLEGVWHFSQIGDQGCRIEVTVDFEPDGMLARILVPMSDKIANVLVDAFIERIETIRS